MTTNAMPQQPAERAVPGGLSVHDRHVGAIAAWLWETTGSDLDVDVVTGTNRVAVARGRYVDMEAHPTAKGVYRVVFDSSRGGPEGPTGEQWVTVGHEVVDVTARDDLLVIDKGSQRVEIRVVRAAAPEPVTESAEPAVAPAIVPANVPAGVPDAPEVAPAAHADTESILESYAPALEAVATAPLYQNSALGGSHLFGETRLEVVGDDLLVTTRRMRHGTPFLVLTGIIVSAFVLAGLAFYGLAVFNANTSGIPADPEYLRTTLTGTAAVAAAAAVLYFGGRLLSAGRRPETLTVPLASARGRRAGRWFILRLPVGRKGRTRKLVLKPAGKADKARLEKILEAFRG